MDITKEIEKLFSKSSEQDLNKLSDEELNKLVDGQINEVQTGWMSSTERDELKDKIDKGRAILHARHKGKTEVSQSGDIDSELSSRLKSSLGLESKDDSKELTKESDIKVEGGEPKTNKARYKSIIKKKKPIETSEVDNEGVVPPTNVSGSY